MFNMKTINKNYAFTLVEVLVSITILSLILVSVFNVYISSTHINMKTDITRMLQQNTKSAVELIAEDVRKYWYWSWVTMFSESLSPCDAVVNSNETKEGTKLCIWNNKDYYLAEETSTDTFERVTDWNCEDIKKKCTSVVNKWSGARPIMNSWVDVKKLRFMISWKDVQKVTMLMTLQPATWKWIKTSIIENNRFYFQTTISQRTNLK